MKIKIDNELIHESSETDDFFVDNDLLDKKDWIKQAWIGKVNNCEKRFKREWYPKFEADSKVKQIPTNRDELVTMIKKRPDYKNRKKREAEIQKKEIE